MAPAQSLMDIHPDYRPLLPVKLEIDTHNQSVLRNTDWMDYCKETHNERDNLLDEKSNAASINMDVEVDIVTCTKETRSAKAEDPDATEYSSSFANTTSDAEKCSGLSEAEVESQVYDDDNLASPYDDFLNIFQTRKKKLTDHWRSFIHPLMWRCKWTELKLKQLESQVSKYARELAAFKQIKHPGIHQSTYEGICSKFIPFSNGVCKRKVLKRRKRKRVEDIIDSTSYMSKHNLFSYLENKRSNPGSSSMVDNFGNAVVLYHHAHGNDKFGVDNNQLSLELKDNPSEQILWKVEMVQRRVQRLKNQLDSVMSQNAARFSSYENFSLLAPSDGQASSAPSPAVSAGDISGYDLGDLVLPDSISSYGEAIYIPDIIESTVGLLSAADVAFDGPQVGDSCEDIVDNILIHNEAADGEMDIFVGTSNQLVEKHDEAGKGEVGESSGPYPIPKLEPELEAKPMIPQGPSTSRPHLASDFQFPRNKRKRGERRGGPVGWGKKCKSEPDSPWVSRNPSSSA